MNNMYYLIYKITNKINGKYYIGAHKTTDIDDGYMGSGKLISQSIKKYGKENFVKEIIINTLSEELMYWFEKMIIDDELLKDNFSYNLTLGGLGGSRRAGMKNSEEQKRKSSETQLGKQKKNKGQCGKWKRTEKYSEKVSSIVSSQRWVSKETNGEWEVKKIYEYELDSYISSGWVNRRIDLNFIKKVSLKNSKKKRINNGSKTIQVSEDNLPSFLNFGWELGAHSLECDYCGKVLDYINFKKQKHGENCEQFKNIKN